MRELTVRIKFAKESLGSVRKQIVPTNGGKSWPCFLMPRTPDGAIRFEAGWWKSSLVFAASVLGKHHRAVKNVHFDVIIDGRTRTDPEFLYRRYIESDRWILHEAFYPGDTIGINCVVPDTIPDEEFWSLMDLVGRYKGISPFGPRQYGFFKVVSVVSRDRSSFTECQ